MSGTSLLAGLQLDETGEEIVNLLAAILSRQGYMDPANASSRVTLAGTNNIGTVATINSCTQVATLANQTNMGGINAIYDQYAAMQIGPSMLRAQISVT